ncbi:uncharacterized protein [Nicotiana sylvestris]|uniref:uncharacterized protein n=1 Tax=Nicotiana sylvestris TaxID=4096 RepID=UPI00388C6A44
MNAHQTFDDGTDDDSDDADQTEPVGAFNAIVGSISEALAETSAGIHASDYALGGVLLQEGHPVAYKSRKMKDAERRYAAHEKELLAVVHCLCLWRHYLLGTPFMVKTDNTVVSHFMTQPKLNGRQASRRADLASVCLLATLRGSEVATSIKDQIQDLLIKDPAVQYLVDLVGQGKTRQFYMEDGFLKVKGNRLYVPKGGDLRRILLAECHDTLWAGHPGEERTMV